MKTITNSVLSLMALMMLTLGIPLRSPVVAVPTGPLPAKAPANRSRTSELMSSRLLEAKQPVVMVIWIGFACSASTKGLSFPLSKGCSLGRHVLS
jgi:hypothetical protein